LGLFLFETGRLDEALKEYQRELKLHGKLADDFPDVPEYRRRLALTYNGLGGAQIRAKQLEEGEKTLEQARKVLEKLAAESPGVATYPSELGNVLQNLAICIGGGEAAPSQKREQAPRCRQLMEEAVRRQKGALELQPKHQSYREKLGNHYSYLALYSEGTDPAAAERSYRQAIDYKKQLVADFPAIARYRGDLGGALNNFAILLWNQGKLDDAREVLEQAIENQQAALAVNPRNPVYLQFLRNHYGALADLCKQMPQMAEKEEASRQMGDELEKLMAERKTMPPEQFETRVNALLKDLAKQMKAKGK